MDPQRLQIRVLGRFDVRRGDTDIPPAAFGGRLARTLVRLLVTRRGQLVSRDALVEALWPDGPPADPAANLKILVSRARRALGDPSLITAGPAGYAFRGDSRTQVDSELFLARADAGRSHLAAGRHADALEALLSALAEWGGEPLPEDAYAEWAQEYRRRLSRAHLETLERAAAAALALGDGPRAVELAERASALEPLREAAHLLLVEALAASGDAAAALSAFDSFRSRLAEELGVDPSPEAADLHVRVLRGEIVRARRARPAAVPAPAVHEMAFAGREAELSAIVDTLSTGGIMVVSGHAGAGKSRLLSEAEARSPIPVLSARAFRAQRERPWGLTGSLVWEALLSDVAVAHSLPDREAAALADVVPDLGELRELPEPPADPETRRALARQGAVRALGAASRRPLAVMVDDVQWADATSLDFLHLVADRVPQLRLVVAYRPEEVDAGDPAGAFLGDLLGPGDVRRIELGPLPPDAIRELVDDPELALMIAGETDRMALTLKEVLLGLAARGIVDPVPRGRWKARPSFDRTLALRIARTGQHRAIRIRVGSLPQPRRDILDLLALLAREVPPRVLAHATERDQMLVLGALDALARADLVRLGELGWTVAHDVIGETVAARFSPEERAPLHARLAAALEKEEGGDPAELARHLQGAGDARRAASAYAEAARRRLDRFANEEALRLADQGLRLEPAAAVHKALLDVRSEARRRRGDLTGAREDLRSLLAREPSGPDRSLILSRMAMLTSGAEDYERAAELAGAAIAEAGAHPKALAEGLMVKAIVDTNAGRFERAQRRFAEALELYERLGDIQGVAGVLDAAAMAKHLAGRGLEVIDQLDRAARLFLDSGNLVRAGSPRATRGAILIFAGRAEEGLRDIEEALSLARDLGNVEDESYALICRALARSVLARHAEALADAERALEIAESIGHREWTCHALWVLGSIWAGAGNPERAEAPLRRALELAANMPLHGATAAAHLAQVLIRRGDLDAAEPLVDWALANGLPASRHEARLARAELAAARGEPDAAAIAQEALALAEAGGYLVRASRLRELAEAHLPTPRPR